MIVYWKLCGSLSICLRSHIIGSLSIGTGKNRDLTTTQREKNKDAKENTIHILVYFRIVFWRPYSLLPSITRISFVRIVSMRKKKFKYTDLSDKHFCKKCRKPIKKQLVLIKDLPPKLCYKHWLEQKGKHKHSEGDFAPVDIYRRKP